MCIVFMLFLSFSCKNQAEITFIKSQEEMESGKTADYLIIFDH